MMLSSIASSQVNMIAHQNNAQSLAQNNIELEEKKAQKSPDNVEKIDTDGYQGIENFTEQELREIESLKSRDREVKTHEQAHLSAAGGFATGGASFSFKLGPNGVRYAVAGEVQIDTSPVPGDPAATIRKADAIRRAALAPAQPSGQDRSVAAQAAAMATKAQAELLKVNSNRVEPEDDHKDSQPKKIDVSA